MSAGRPVLRTISPDATPEEVAAIVAAIAAVHGGTAAGPSDESAEARDDWVQASRLTARRAGFTRGSWRLSGRIARRTRP